MSISPGFTATEIREFIVDYHLQPYGQKGSWLAVRAVPYHRAGPKQLGNSATAGIVVDTTLSLVRPTAPAHVWRWPRLTAAYGCDRRIRATR